MSTLFVTATGTEIGKTLVTAALCHELRAAGRPVRALKPVLSGYDPATLADSDPGVLLASLGEAASEEAVAAITPWRFSAPLSPDMAAAREGRRLDLAEILAYCRAAEGDPLLIEGIGGAMVPLNERHTVLDWIAELGAPALVVTGSYLGTISHTLTTLAAIRGATFPSPDWSSANLRKARCPWPRRRRPSTATRGRCPPFWWRASPMAPLPGARPRRSRVRWASWTPEDVPSPTRQETPVSKGITSRSGARSAERITTA
ncbi:ATP-dependent dethiobiotin synthetase BioD [Geodia barretti]|uniref:ATP-dependent dethiobiotin synthetase BioD n=1 Tax=Geodia barretti TaxID=519541 RepID=A0AA35SYT0_GEOBA|nr:ATP-dependent dethiobiotin synthetase BioD [Geodia barretti]